MANERIRYNRQHFDGQLSLIEQLRQRVIALNVGLLHGRLGTTARRQILGLHLGHNAELDRVPQKDL
jgi:hypothetical protein